MPKRYIINYKEEREKDIIKTSVIGLISNIILSVFKVVVGIFANSTVIILDGVENVSNALGSVLTIVGIKLSGKAPNKKHPFGYGRIEYVTDLLVSSLVIYIGVTAFIAGVKNILYPTEVEYTYVTYAVLMVSAIVKYLLSRHEKTEGYKHKSRALIGAAVDSFANALISISIILSSLIDYKWHIRLENYIAIAIAILIIRGGSIMIKNTMEEILGKRASSRLLKKIKNTILEFEYVLGVYELLLHSYGRERNIGSVHIEIPSNLSMFELDFLERKILSKIYEKYGVVLSGISIYAVNIEDKEVYAMHQFIKDFVSAKEGVRDAHGILIDKVKKKIRFDVIVDSSVENREEKIERLKAAIEKKYENYEVSIKRDMDF